MKNKLCLLTMLLLFSIVSYGQSNSNELVKNFFKTYKYDSEKAVRNIYKTNIWTTTAQNDIEKVVKAVNGFTKEYMGIYYGYELIEVKKVSVSYERHSYLVKYGRQPLRYIFTFYKPKDEWVLYSFSLDDKINNNL